MASKRMDFSSFVGKLLSEEDTDVLREGVRVLAQALMDAEVSTQIGAELYERTDDRTARRNGYRTRTWDTRVGTVELRVPKVVPGTYFPSLLEPRRRAERALAAVIQEAYVKGISTRKVDDLVRALGMDGISRSEVDRTPPTAAGRHPPRRSATRPRCRPGSSSPSRDADPWRTR